MVSKLLHGVFAPVTTPFDGSEHILTAKLIENIEKYNETGLSGYMPLGSNGEFQGLTDEESFDILCEIRRRSPSKTIVAGCGRESAYKTVEFIKKAADCGLDMAFVLPPHYFADRMTDDALSAYYTYVADRSPVPVVIYNAPKFASGILVSEPLLQQLALHPNIAAMKNSSPHPNADYIRCVKDVKDFCIIAGNIGSFYPGLCEGAAGGVLSTASYMPEYCCELYNCFVRGDHEKALTLHTFLNELSKATIGRHGVAGVKLGLDLRGFYGGRTRIPLLDIPEAEKKRIEEYFTEKGIVKFKAQII